MNPAAKITICALLLISVSSLRVNDHFVTFNTSARQTYVSVSIASNLDAPFTIYSPVLFDTPVTFAPGQGGFQIDPVFPEDSNRLYNSHSSDEYWYAFKKSINPQTHDTAASFGLAKITANGQTQNFVLPLFSLPLSWINLDNLYRCDDVLISYHNTGSVLDLTIFSERESWHLFPETLWGFRHKDEEINFSRQTFPVGTNIEIDVGPNKYCILNDNLARNTYNLVEQGIYTLEDLFVKYSTSLQLRDKASEEEL